MNPTPCERTMPSPAASVATGVAVQRLARLVIEAECPTCGRVGDEAAEGMSIVPLALAHTSATGHVVILNGTTDLPEADDEGTAA